jgi:predicted DNA-binding protein YlxM (UPF0122 family)
MTRITPERIASMRQYWRDGFSLPEIATMTKSTVATIRKYLKSDIQTYISEHEQAKAKREQILPTDTTSIKDLSLEQFAEYVKYEFDSIPNSIEAIKDTFYQIKDNEELNYDQVIKLRDIYEARLNQLTSKVTIQQAIKAFKDEHQIKIPIPRQSNDWSEERLYEHLVFWLVANRDSRAIATAKLKELDSLEKRQQFLESL